MSVNVHHLISDAWSVGVLMRELAAVYGAHVADRPPNLPDLPVQYGNFTLWQREMAQDGRLRKGPGVWTHQLHGMPPLLSMPADRPRPAVAEHRGAALFCDWPESLATGVEELARREGATTYQIMLAAFNIFLQRYTFQDDIAVGSPFSGRDELETEDLIGFFVNTQALRTNLSGDPAFGQLLRRVRDVVLAAGTHQQAPFMKSSARWMPAIASRRIRFSRSCSDCNATSPKAGRSRASKPHVWTWTTGRLNSI